MTGYYNFNTADHNVVRSWWSNPDGGFDAAVASLRQNVDGPLKALYAYHAGKAAERGLELTTYESGYGEVATDETADYQQFLIDVQRQPELYDIEKANYQNFKDAGGGLYMNFGIIGAPSKWGSWSALESLYQETSPRYEALTDWNATVAPWYETGRDPSVFDSSWMLHQNSGLTITSNGGGDTAMASIAENTTAVTTVTATDPDAGQTLSYSIGGGADASKFTISSSTGALSFVTAPNFELPTDAGGNNVYDVIVQVSDGHGGSDTQAIAVTVTPVNDAPVANDDFASVAKGRAITADAQHGVLVNDSDLDSDGLSVSAVNGSGDNVGQTVVGTYGSLTVNTDGSYSYVANKGNLPPQIVAQDSFTYTASDGHGGTSTATLTVTITKPGALTAGNGPTFELAAFAPGAGGWSSDDLYKRELADVNGDGMADIVGFGHAGVYVSLATGNGHFAAPTFELAAFAPGAGGWSSDDLYKRELADVNGDGMADIVGFGHAGVYVSLATGNGHFAAPTFELAAFAPGAGGWSSDDLYKRELADVNGDGMADIVGFGHAGVYVSLATGNGHFAAPTFELAAFAPGAGGWSSDDLYKRELADVNGDGMADIVGFGHAGVYVSLATGNGHFAAPTFELAAFAPGAGGWSSDDLYKRELADVNGDGMADIVGFGHSGVYVSLATGNGHFAAPTFELAAFAPGAGGWSSDDLYKRELADVNGDGRADIVGFGQCRGLCITVARFSLDVSALAKTYEPLAVNPVRGRRWALRSFHSLASGVLSSPSFLLDFEQNHMHVSAP